MKKIFVLGLASVLLHLQGYSQSDNSANSTTSVRPKAIGFSFIMNDFRTPQRIRSGTLSSVLTNKQWAKFSETEPGIAISYFKGLRSQLDFAATFAIASGGAFETNDGTIDSDVFMEVDASLQVKLLPEGYYVIPYASLGAGISKAGVHYGAFIPVGAGLRFNVFKKASFFINSQYRVPVTTSNAGYHFMHGIGVAGTIGN